jgi:hypothetical protein
LKEIQLFGSGVSGKSLTVTDQRRVNVYYEVREDGEKSKLCVYGTPGSSLFAAIGANPVRGMYVFGGKMVVVAGSGAYTVSSVGVVTSIGTLQTSAGFVGMSDNGIGVLIVDGSKGYFWNGTVFTSPITDANFPNGCSTVTFNDTFFLVDDPAVNGQFRSSPGFYIPGVPWVALAFGNASSNPDPIVAVDSDHGYIIVWGSASIEFHQDVGTSPWQYAPIISATQQVGLAAKWSRAKFNNTVAFLGTNLQGGYSVYVGEGFVPKAISNKDIDAIFLTFTTVSDAVAMSYIWDGHPFYALTFPTASRTFLYDGSTNTWSEQQTGVSAFTRYYANQSVVFNGNIYVSDFATGNIYKLDDTVFTDNGTTIARWIQTRHINDKGNMLGIDEVFLDMETGVGLQSGQGSTPQVMVSTSKDGGRTFGNERLMGIGQVGQYLGPRATLRRFGASRDFVFRFKMTDPVKFVVTYGAAVSRGSGK